MFNLNPSCFKAKWDVLMTLCYIKIKAINDLFVLKSFMGEAKPLAQLGNIPLLITVAMH